MIQVAMEGRVRRITLAGGVERNYLSSADCKQLSEIWRAADSDAATGVILIDAEGPVFCAGMDPAACDELLLQPLSKSLVVAAQGPAISAGVGLLAKAHIALAAQGTTFGITDIRQNRYSEALYACIAGAIGQRRATELCLTGRIFSANEALAWGLVHQMAPPIELEDRAEAVAKLLAAADPSVVSRILA